MTMIGINIPGRHLLSQALSKVTGRPQLRVLPGGRQFKELPDVLSDQQPVPLRLVPDKPAAPLGMQPLPDRTSASEGSALEILDGLLKLLPGLSLTEGTKKEVLAHAMQNASSTRRRLTELQVAHALCDVMELKALEAASNPNLSAKDARTQQALLTYIGRYIEILETLQQLDKSYAQFAQRPIEPNGAETTVSTLNWAQKRQLAGQLMQYEIDAPAIERAENYIASLDRKARRVMDEAIHADLDTGRLYFEVVTRLTQQNQNDPARVTNEMITQAVRQAVQEAKQARQRECLNFCV